MTVGLGCPIIARFSNHLRRNANYMFAQRGLLLILDDLGISAHFALKSQFFCRISASCRSISASSLRFCVNCVSAKLVAICGTSQAIDLRTVDRHPLASVGTLVLGLRCSWCPGSAPMPKLLGSMLCRQQGAT
jgi:hypothetical protein